MGSKTSKQAISDDEFFKSEEILQKYKNRKSTAGSLPRSIGTVGTGATAATGTTIEDPEEGNVNLSESDYISMTIPSMFDAISYTKEENEITETASAFAFTEEKMMAMVAQYTNLYGDELTADMIDSIYEVINSVEAQINMCEAFERRPVDSTFARRFVEVMPHGAANISHFSKAVVEKMNRHFVYTIITHKILLEYLSKPDLDAANDLINQVAVGHALMKVTVDDFKLIALVWCRILLVMNVIDDANMGPIVTYFNKFNNLIAKAYSMHGGKHVTSGRQKGRNSNARENYRILKRWLTTIEMIHARGTDFSVLLNKKSTTGDNLAADSDDDQDDVTIPTIVLRERDWFMSKLCRYKRKETEQAVDDDDQT